jgi:putative ABC transport system substrate-binding protein
MDRRDSIIALLALGTSPFAAEAQPSTVYRIGWISVDRAAGSPFLDPLRMGLRNLGYVEGRNLVIDARWGDGSMERLEKLAVTQGPSVFSLRKAGAAMPVVFGFSGDPVEAGLADSLARPGRNFTGMSFLSLELVGKRMELLKEMMPGLKRVAIIARPEHAGEQGELRTSQAAANSMGLSVAYFPIKSARELELALAAIPESRSEAIVAFPDAIMMRFGEAIAAFSVKNQIPAISGWAQFAERGNVMTYGPVLSDGFRRLAYYVDRILKGAKPADLPVELPSSVELVVNLRTAKAIGLTVPRSLLVRAERIIE